MAKRFVPDAGDIIWLEFSPQAKRTRAGHEQAGRRPSAKKKRPIGFAPWKEINAESVTSLPLASLTLESYFPCPLPLAPCPLPLAP
jgi:hypothetical protein